MLYRGCLLLLMLVSAGGCASMGSDLAVSSLEHGQSYSQGFKRVYAGRSAEGEYDIVMVEEAADQATPEKAGQPLFPMAAMPLRQVLHIRVLWRPLNGPRQDFPAATNASISWYVLGATADESPDMLQYNGVGQVSVYPASDETRIFIRSAMLSPGAQRGKIGDPIGRLSLSGSAIAQNDDERVRGLLADLKSIPDIRMGHAASVGPAGGPPARSPPGP